MTNFPPVGTVVCGCDEDAACSYHAGIMYAKEPANAHVAQPFRSILDEMIAEAQTNNEMAQALDALYGIDFITEYNAKKVQEAREIERLAKVDSREVYCDRGPDGDNCLDCPTCRM
jgi:hypothetical protein